MTGLEHLGIHFFLHPAIGFFVLALVMAFLKNRHYMGFVTLGIFLFSVSGISGAILQMLNHGITTGGLFMVRLGRGLASTTMYTL